MIGFNGGLLGVERSLNPFTSSLSGIWTSQEQVTRKRVGKWELSPFLLIPGSGSNNGTVFTDYSYASRVITRFGDTITTTAQSKYYGSSIYFDGSGDYLQVASSADLSLGTSDFTVEMWLYPTSATGFRTFLNYWGGSGVGFYFWLEPVTGGFAIDILLNSSSYLYNSSANQISANTWSHFAVCRSGSTVRVFVNGVSIYSFSNSTDFTSNSILLASNAGNSSGSNYQGYMQDIRAIKAALYTSNFTPPTAFWA